MNVLYLRTNPCNFDQNQVTPICDIIWFEHGIFQQQLKMEFFNNSCKLVFSNSWSFSAAAAYKLYFGHPLVGD